MDLKENAAKGLARAFQIFRTDLEAIPEDAFGKKFGPSTRTIEDIVYEVNLVNDHTGMTMRGEKPFDWPEGDWILAPADFKGKEVVIAAFDKSCKRILETVESFTPEQMEETTQTEDGETTRFQGCQFLKLHAWYHSGQLNYIQTLLGDGALHWE